MLLCAGLSSRLERAIELLRLDTEESTKRCCRDPSFSPRQLFVFTLSGVKVSPKGPRGFPAPLPGA